MLRNISILIVALILHFASLAQSDFKFMTYNILNFDETNTNRIPYYKTILDDTQPDILVMEEVKTEAGFNLFLDQVLGSAYGGATYIPNGNNIVQTLCYKKDRFKFISTIPIPTALRDINQFTLVSLDSGDTLRVFGVHLKASNGVVEEEQRRLEIVELRKVTDNLTADQDYIVTGDFNFYSSDESAYVLLKSPNATVNGNVVDPINMTGVWNNPAYAQYHSQSPRVRVFDGGATGGMDDRFDLILYSQSIAAVGGLDYVTNSTKVIGNDGNHYNDSVNKMPNSSVSQALADALHYASDHLPVIATFHNNNSTLATGTDVQTSCGSLTWIDGNTYTTNNNTATHLLSGAAASGGDSLVTLNLTILQPAFGTDLRTSCSPLTWLDGNTYAASNNTATHTMIGGSMNGCDSIITLNFTRFFAPSSVDTHVACNSLQWIDGNVYTSDNNTATHTIIGGAANGCDSIISLNLTINNGSVFGTDVRNACNPITWIDGNTYTTSNNTATYTYVGGAVGGCDSIVTLNLTINAPVNHIDNQTACDSYTWIDGNTYTSSNNTATHTYSGGAVNGCDSIVTLNLTMNQHITTTDVQTACGSYTWIDGNTYTSDNNTATFTVVGGAPGGCNIDVTLDLTITNQLTGTDTIVTCGSYTWIDGNTYTTNNTTASHLLVGGSVQGCDSLVYLNLTINNLLTGTDAQVACETYTWIDGNTYTSSNNTATYLLAGAAQGGCDSLVQLNLTILQPKTGIDVRKACGSYKWIDGITYTANNNTATYTFIGGAANGCDSTVTLNLTIGFGVIGVDTQTACSSFTWIDGNTYTTNNNTATHKIIGGAANGCDSIVLLNLTMTNTLVSYDKVNSCGPYTWIDGNTYTTNNNTATHTLIGAGSAGCDSMLILDLTISQATSSTTVESVCSSYIAPDGNTYTNSGNYTVVIPNAQGCDSIITIILSVNQPTSSTITETACASYTAPDGQLYTSSGNYTAIISNKMGCDSTITIALTINQPSSTNLTENACSSYTAPDGQVYTSSGNYTAVLSTMQGCDSLININLTIQQQADLSISTQGVSLTANQFGAAYQWLDCENNYAVISGETGQVFTAKENGVYAVLLGLNGCSDTSACVSVTEVVGLEVLSTLSEMNLYPNPTNGNFYLDLGVICSNVQIQVTDLQGRLFKHEQFVDKQLIAINLKEAAGSYLVHVLISNKETTVFHVQVN